MDASLTPPRTPSPVLAPLHLTHPTPHTLARPSARPSRRQATQLTLSQRIEVEKVREGPGACLPQCERGQGEGM